MELLDRINEDAEQVDAPEDADLKLVALLAQKQIDLLGNGIAKGPTGDAIQGLRDWAKRNGIGANEALAGYSIADLIGTLTERLKEYRQVSEMDLPAAMKRLSLTEFKLSNGYTVSITEDLRAAVKADKWDELIPWLKEHGLDGIVKSEVKFNFDIDDTGIDTDTEIGDALLRLAIKHGIIPVEDEDPKLTRADAILALAKEEGMIGEEKMSINAATLKAVVKRERVKGTEFPDNLFSIQEADKAVVVPAKVKK